MRAKNGVKLAFTIGATSGNQARVLAEQIMQQQFKQIGVKLTIKNSPDILDINLPGFDYQTIIYAWVGSPDPYGNNVIWLSTAIPARCSPKAAKAGACDYSGQNYTKVKDPAVDADLNATDLEPDPVKRGRAVQRGRPAARHQQRHLDPALPEAHATRVQGDDRRRAGQPDAGRVHLEHRGLDLHRFVTGAAPRPRTLG